MSDKRIPHESDPMQEHMLARVREHIGKDFLADVAHLARAEGYKLSDVAKAIHDGRHVELARVLGERIGMPGLLMPCARAFVLPVKYQANPQALLCHLYRKSH